MISACPQLMLLYAAKLQHSVAAPNDSSLAA